MNLWDEVRPGPEKKCMNTDESALCLLAQGFLKSGADRAELLRQGFIEECGLDGLHFSSCGAK
jgi:hypothetical protein